MSLIAIKFQRQLHMSHILCVLMWVLMLFETNAKHPIEFPFSNHS